MSITLRRYSLIEGKPVSNELGVWVEADKAQYAVDDLEDRIEALQSRVSELERLLEAQAGWIVCSERMPNKGDWCWVVWEGSVQHEAWQFLGDHWATWDESADPAKRDEFSHWLLLPPIPHPPSEGEK